MQGAEPWVAPQVTAELLSERLGARVWAKRYAPGGHTWAKHLADAQDAGNPLHELLGAGGTLEYDYVIFQVLADFVHMGSRAVCLVKLVCILLHMQSAHASLLCTKLAEKRSTV